MHMKASEDNQLSADLRGQLPESERAAVEARHSQDGQYIERIGASKTKLIRDDRRGDFARALRQQNDTRHFAKKERRENLERISVHVAERHSIRRPVISFRTVVRPLAAFVLSPGVLKGENERQKRLSIPPGIDLVRLDLEFTARPGVERYRAILRTVDGRETASQELDGPTAAGILSVALNAASLPTDDFILTIEGRSTGGVYRELESYSFGVIRQ